MEAEPFRKLFIGGLNTGTTEDTLRDYYEHWGEVVDCVVMRDSSRRSRGFGFVTFKKAHMVDDAQKARPHKIDNKVVETKRAMPKEDSDKPEAHVMTQKVYLSGVKESIDEVDIRTYFEQFGEVESVEIILDKETRKKRGFAFITFSDYDPVDKIVLIKSHNIKGYRCDARKGLSKEEVNRLRVTDGLGARGRSSRQGGRFDGSGGSGRGRGNFRERDEFDSREEFQGRADFGGRDGFGVRGGFDERDRFGYREDFGERDRFGGRDDFGARWEFGSRDGFGGRENYSGQGDYDGRNGLGARGNFGGREFSERDGYGQYERNYREREGFRDRDERYGSYGGYGSGEMYASRSYGSAVGGSYVGIRDNYDNRAGGFGSDYGTGRGGGPVRDSSSSYAARSTGPYGSGYGSSGSVLRDAGYGGSDYDDRYSSRGGYGRGAAISYSRW